jgi:hypothetical protein
MRYVLSEFRYEGRDDDLVSMPDPLVIGRASLLSDGSERSGRLTAVATAS